MENEVQKKSEHPAIRPLIPPYSEVVAARDHLKNDMDNYFKELDASEPGIETPAAEPTEEPAQAKVPKNIEFVPGPATVPPEVQAELERLRTLEREVDIRQDDSFTQQYVKPVNDPDMVPAEWWSEQIGKMYKAPPVMKAKVEQKVAKMLSLQEQPDAALREWNRPENFQARQQAKQARDWEARLRWEAESRLNEEAEFANLRALRDRANGGDAGAKAEFNEAEAEFREYLVKLLQEKPNTPPGRAVERALKYVNSRKNGLAQPRKSSTAQNVSRATSQTPNRSKSDSTRLSKGMFLNPRASVNDAFNSYDWDTDPKRLPKKVWWTT